MASQRVLKHYTTSEEIEDGLFLNMKEVHEHHWLLEHTHDFPEIIFIMRGKGNQYINGQPISAGEGELYVIPIGTTHVFRPSSGSLAVRNMILHPQWLAGLAASLPDPQLCSFIDWLLGQHSGNCYGNSSCASDGEYSRASDAAYPSAGDSSPDKPGYGGIPTRDVARHEGHSADSTGLARATDGANASAGTGAPASSGALASPANSANSASPTSPASPANSASPACSASSDASPSVATSDWPVRWLRVVDRQSELLHKSADLQALYNGRPPLFQTALWTGVIELLRLLCLATDNASRQQVEWPLPEAADPLQARITALIQAAPPELLSAKYLANKLAISERHLARLFKGSFGVTINGYLQQWRIKRSIMLLAHTSLAIPDIMAQIGLRDIDHFYKLFKHFTGTTPARYRSQLREQQ